MVKIVCMQNGEQPAVGLLRDGRVEVITGVTVLDIIRSPEVLSSLPVSATTDLQASQVISPLGLPPRNIFCVGWNYERHFHEGQASRSSDISRPRRPTFFTKATTTINGAYSDIRVPHDLAEKLDWEVELAVVIGKSGYAIPTDAAMSHVFGYMAANDISARDVQLSGDHPQWFQGKSLDGTCPVGPWIATADEVDDPMNLRLWCSVNGDCVQDASTVDMAFDIPTLISELSRGMTLLPGDILLTGTPEGVGLHQSPPRFLHDGDVVETEIETLGTLCNTIRIFRRL